MKHSICNRFEKVGPGGKKCPCCNQFHGKSKKLLTRQVRARLNVFFNKEMKEMKESIVDD